MWRKLKRQTAKESLELNMIKNQRTSMQFSAGDKPAVYYSTTV